MIRSYFGLTRNPSDLREIERLPGQQEIHDTLKVHCQQGGLCLVLGVPGTGKSVIKQALQRLPENQHLVATVARTLHTYTVELLCDASRIAFESCAFRCERKLVEQAFGLNHAGKALTTILDDAHLNRQLQQRTRRLVSEPTHVTSPVRVGLDELNTVVILNKTSSSISRIARCVPCANRSRN